MKKHKLSLVIILSFLFLFTIACSEESTLSSPEKVSNENILDKKHKSDKNPNSVSKFITVKNGGKLKLDLDLKGEFLGKKIEKEAKFFAEIKIAPKTVPQDITLTMTLDHKTGMISFHPQMDFMKVVPLTISVKGVNLKKMDINEEDIKLAYLDVAGDNFYLESDKIWYKNDSFGIKEVELPHYNKFGFTEKAILSLIAKF
jgi:hypothetical protein